MSWQLHCPWCSFYVLVGNRGGRGADQGSGVEAAELMREHVEDRHGHTWAEFLATPDLGKQPDDLTRAGA